MCETIELRSRAKNAAIKMLFKSKEASRFDNFYEALSAYVTPVVMILDSTEDMSIEKLNAYSSEPVAKVTKGINREGLIELERVKRDISTYLSTKLSRDSSKDIIAHQNKIKLLSYEMRRYIKKKFLPKELLQELSELNPTLPASEFARREKILTLKVQIMNVKMIFKTTVYKTPSNVLLRTKYLRLLFESRDLPQDASSIAHLKVVILSSLENELNELIGG